MSTWEHLQNVLMQVHNRIVREEFADLDNDNDDDILTPRSSLRAACLIRDADSATTSLNRMMLFYVMLRKASDLHPALYTTPVERYQELLRFAPQVTLYFREDIDDVEEGYGPIDAEVSFRIYDKTERTITMADLRTIGQKIRTEFATGSGYRWRKGRYSLSYRDPELGYRLRVRASSESEGREVISKVLDIQGHTINREKLNINQLDQAPPIVPPMHNILGRSRRKFRNRPVGWVRFIYAEAHVWGEQNAITLIDRSGRRRNPLIAAR